MVAIWMLVAVVKVFQMKPRVCGRCWQFATASAMLGRMLRCIW